MEMTSEERIVMGQGLGLYIRGAELDLEFMAPASERAALEARIIVAKTLLSRLWQTPKPDAAAESSFQSRLKDQRV